ncbi:MAG TPA: PQQ-binding-like beta-propeller repeat protein [Vicinamibacterales bacterium]|nr:PQQ-binding-like beta-propeller repeat protein [Vicinamibacterales bacterium]
MAETHASAPRKPIRLWPGVVLVVLQWLAILGVPRVVPDAGALGMMGAVLCAVLVLLWWVFFSRAPWSERLGAIALMVIAVLLTSRLVHLSISNAAMGMMPYILSIPLLSLALVGAVAATRNLSTGRRRLATAAAILLSGFPLMLLRTGGMSGGGGSDFHWRWTPTPEERLLAQGDDEVLGPPPGTSPAPAPGTPTPSGVPAAGEPAKKPEPAPSSAPPSPAVATHTDPAFDWPGFRGPQRDAIVRGVRIETDWSRMPPVEFWRRPIGPGWSSFAVRGNLFYTQEQRGEDEIVSCYNLTTGKPVWRHRDAARFYESNGGPGPRGTPTLVNGRVYSHGATGIVNALDASTGAVVWSRNSSTDTGSKMPGWGFASSPLVVNDLVVVASSGRLIAYEAATGKPRWQGPAKAGGYASPQLATIAGVPQILLLTGAGIISVSPDDGTMLWQNEWEGVPILQPAQIEDGDLLITSGDMMGGMGMRRISVTHGASGWKVEERWTSRGLKPYYSDLVVHKGYAFGFDGNILACIDLQDGQRKWKGGRYGQGQLVLLRDQDLLMVLSEEGELALVKATPDQFTEVAKVPAIEGKTWNHPVFVGDMLLVRNGEEMAAFKFFLANR